VALNNCLKNDCWAKLPPAFRRELVRPSPRFWPTIIERGERENLAGSMTVRMVRLRYTDASDLFGKLGKTLKANIAGKPFALFYDSEFKDEGADFECCFPIKKLRHFEGIESREIEGGQALSLVHRGPFAAVGRSYARLFSHLAERGLQAKRPSREVYLKGPGIIFRGNPKGYLTQLQCFTASRVS
jgi:effector-binding domain-containing protein